MGGLSIEIRGRPALCDGHFVIKIHILNRLQQCGAFAHWALEGFAAGDQAHAAGAFVDHCRRDGFFEIAGAR